MKSKVTIKVAGLTNLPHGAIEIHGEDDKGNSHTFTLFEDIIENLTSRHDITVGNMIEITAKTEIVPVKARLIR